MATESTSIRATEQATDALRRLAFTLSAETGRRVTLGAALEAAVTVAANDIPAVLAALEKGEK